MKVSELKILKEKITYKKILDELKIKGLDKLYIYREYNIDYIDIIFAVIEFLQVNKKVLEKLNEEQYENIIIIIIDEIFGSININISEEQIRKFISLLRNVYLC
jgi:disulfide oxidoreductase YuzD